MAKTFIIGHGAWNPGDGYVSVPKGYSISFYTKNSKWMCSDDIWELIKGTSTLDVEQESGEFKTAPNMRVFPPEPEWPPYATSIKPATATLYMTTDVNGVTLKDIFRTQPAGSYVWACCRNLGLN